MLNVVWYGHPEEGQRWWKNCTIMLNEMLDTYDCRHTNVVPDTGGAVVVIHGESCMDKVTRLNLDIQKLKWVVLIYLGDECQEFPIERISHPRMKLWIQDPDPKRFSIMDRFLPGGWSPGIKRLDIDKDLDWFFAGQITHSHREACAAACRTIPGGGFIIETRGYTQGIGKEEYNRCMNRARFIPCPSGPTSPDSTRVWESLQCGAVPILDASSPNREPGFWDECIPGHPFILMTEWSDLPFTLKTLLADCESYQRKISDWWEGYKADYLTWLKKDMEELNGIIS